jgi:5'-nucleotidase
MKILLTNDDGYGARGLSALVEILKPFGELTVVGPKFPQSAMSMAVNLGQVPIAVKRLPDRDGVRWWYVDATPSSCVKYGLDEIFTDGLPDVVVSGINHGANAASASMYSATVGAAKEGALAGVLSIAVSVDDFSPDADFSEVARWFPEIFRRLTQNPVCDKQTFYNINFPKGAPLGIRISYQGTVHWTKEFRDCPFPAEAEAGETVYIMAGDLTDDARNTDAADHRQMSAGYITICPLKLDATDYAEKARLETLF